MVKGAGATSPRKPRQKAKTSPADEKPVGGAGHNSADDAAAKEVLARQGLDQFLAEDRKEKAATAAKKAIRKRLKAEGISREQFDMLLEMELDPDRATEKYQQLVKNVQIAATWASHDLKNQGVLFGDLDRTPVDERAFADGRKTGIGGKSCIVPAAWAGTPAGQKWIDGWQDGQADLAKNGFKQLAEDHVDATVTRGAAKPSAPADDTDEEEPLPWDDGLGDAPDTTKAKSLN